MKYHKSYYISRGGLELALAQINNRWVWFQYSNTSWNDISKSNFLCNWNCSFESDIHGIGSKISKLFDQGTWCKDPFVLNGGESLVLPLFRDIFSGSVIDSLQSPIQYKNLAFNLSNTLIETNDSLKRVNLWIVFLSGSDIHDQWFFFKAGSLSENSIKNFVGQFESYASNVFIENKSLWDYFRKDEIFKGDYMRSYMILSNPQNQSEIKFCMSVEEQAENKLNNFLSLPYYYIKVVGKTSDFLLGLDLQINQPIPSFLANVYSDF